MSALTGSTPCAAFADLAVPRCGPAQGCPAANLPGIGIALDLLRQHWTVKAGLNAKRLTGGCDESCLRQLRAG